jgi:hypothetical protein
MAARYTEGDVMLSSGPKIGTPAELLRTLPREELKAEMGRFPSRGEQGPFVTTSRKTGFLFGRRVERQYGLHWTVGRRGWGTAGMTKSVHCLVSDGRRLVSLCKRAYASLDEQLTPEAFGAVCKLCSERAAKF